MAPGAAHTTAAAVAVLMAGLLLADVALGQTFSYSRGWKSGKRASASAASLLAARDRQDGAGVGGGALPMPMPMPSPLPLPADEQPLYRFFMESRDPRDSRPPVLFHPWQNLEEQMAMSSHYSGRGAHSDQNGDHEDR